MATQGGTLSDGQKRVLATFLSGRPLGSITDGDASAMSNRCAGESFEAVDGPMWSGWGREATNSRFQPDPGLTADQVPRLTLRWAFGFPNAASAYSQPLVAGGRVFVWSDATFVYSLDAASGCVHWSYRASAGVRTAPSIGPLTADGAGGVTRFAVYFGDIEANVYALDAETGELLWTRRADLHRFARITGAPALHAGRLYVPVASLEESVGGLPEYECCTFRGSVVAYAAGDGRELWKTYTIAAPSQPTRITSIGTKLYGPSGGAVWSAPTIDVNRGLLYVTTGDAYSAPADEATDAVMAIELASGHVVWVRQLTPNDIWLVGCRGVRQPGDSETCPEEMGPDADFGSSASLETFPDGRSLVIAQQKSALVWALDPDREGEVVWQHRIGSGGPVQWGHASDGQVGYFAAPDARFVDDLGGVFALRLGTGERVWRAAPACEAGSQDCSRTHLAAVTAIPGAVFSGSADGILRAYAPVDGRVLWAYDTARSFDTVNGVLAKGGSFGWPGPTVAGGMVFVNSGYSAIGGNGAGKVLLAFGPE
jgi:polyvinyl alcohol dehydrogenase (cytochrome)